MVDWRPLSVLAALVLVTGTAAAHEPVRAWQGSRTVVGTKHLVPAMKSAEEYWDKYTFNADFGERGSFYFSMGVTNLGPGDGKMESRGRLSVDGRKFEWKDELGRGDWKFTAEPFSITAGNAAMSGTPQKLELKNVGGADAFELTFTPIARPWRPRSGLAQFGKERDSFDVTLFPLSKVTGRFKMGGGDWQEIEGRGYGSHTWSDLMMYSMARWTLDFRGINGDHTVYMRELGGTDKYGRVRIPYVVITKGNEVVVESYDYQFTPTDLMTDSKHPNGYVVPESFTLVGKDSDEDRQFRASIKKKKLNKRKDYLDDMGSLKAAVVGRYSKPVLYEYDVDYTFEVKSGESVDRLQGTGKYEFNALNK